MEEPQEPAVEEQEVSEASTVEETDPNDPSMRRVRKLLAIALAFVTLLLVASSYLTDRMYVCRDALSDSGSAVPLCGPASNDDLLIVGGVILVIAALLWFEISEIPIPGVIGLKRSVEQLDSKVDSVILAVQSVQQQQSVKIDISPLLPPNLATLQPLSQESATATVQEANSLLRDIPPRRAVKEAQIIAGWEQLSEYVGPYMFKRTYRGDLAYDPNSPPYWLRGWYLDYREPLEQIWRARNLLAHEAERLTDNEVDEVWRAVLTVVRSLDMMREGSQPPE